ncbi:MAG TPA: YqgE/AlgH family protein [Thermoanaerobaculia bacterium]|nr:YqgE/AlgH family protein [Thermoanaerobaculia bacterium]
MQAMTTDLQTPVLLVALPQVVDPFFNKSVVLLIHHDEEGSLGLIVNRPTGISVGDILEGMEIPWSGDAALLTHFGGPVQPQLGTVLFTPAGGGNGLLAGSGNGSSDDGGEGPSAGLQAASEVAPGVALTQHVADLGRLAASPPSRFRLFLGYAGWGEGQLLEEIVRNDWLVAPVDADLIFSANPDQAWASALRSVGVDPETLPSWSPAGFDDDAN